MFLPADSFPMVTNCMDFWFVCMDVESDRLDKKTCPDLWEVCFLQWAFTQNPEAGENRPGLGAKVIHLSQRPWTFQ